MHPNSSYCSSVALENRAGTLTVPVEGTFSSLVIGAESRMRFGSQLQGLLLFLIHRKGKCGNISFSAWAK